MCVKCKKAVIFIGLQPEAWAMKGCAKLWQTWCTQNKELVEREMVAWLYDNSQCLRIMGLKALQPKIPTEKFSTRRPSNFPGYSRRQLLNNLRLPYRQKKAKTERNG